MNSSKKGADGERELAALLEREGFHTERGGTMSYGSAPDLYGLPGVHIEVKRCEQLRLSEWMVQAIRDSEKFRDGRPAIFHRRNREGWLVTMRLGDWIRLYKDARRNRD